MDRLRLKFQRLERLYKVMWKHRSNNKVRFAPKILRRSVSTPNKPQIQDSRPSSKNQAFKHVVLVLSVVASSIGCGFHIWYISDTYFDYDTTTSISIGTYDSYELPAITVCISLKGSFNKKKWFRRFKAEEIEIGSDIPSELTIQELNDMGPDMERDGILDYYIRLNLLQFEGLHRWRPTVKSIHVEHDLNCETHFLRKMDNSSIRYSCQTKIVTEFKYFEEDYVRMVNGSHSNAYRVYVHPYGEKFRLNPLSVEKEYVDVQSRESVGARLTASTRYILLPAPYKTNCTNYSEINPTILSQADCVYNCIRRMSKNYLASGEWPCFLPVYMDDKQFNWTTLSIQDIGAQFRNLYLNHTGLDVFCQQNECAVVDCTQNRVSMKQLYHSDISGVDYNDSLSTFEIQFPAEPSRTYTSHPKIELVEYLSYVAGVLSLWLGVSAFGSFAYFGEKFRKLHKRRKHNEVTGP